MNTLPKRLMAGGFLLALGLASPSLSLGQIGNFTAPLGQPAFNNYSVPYGQMGQPAPNQYAAPYGQLGLPVTNGQLLPGYAQNFARPAGAPSPFGQPIYAQSYFGIPNYALPALRPASASPNLSPYASYSSNFFSARAGVYTPTAPLGYITNYAQPVLPSAATATRRSLLIPH